MTSMTSLIPVQVIMSIYGIQGLPLELTVVACYNLEDKEWISRQDPYVSVEYGNTKYRTKTCTDGGRNPTFQEKFIFSLIEGLREINVVVWNSHTLSADEHIGTGRVQLHKALSQGFDDVSWPIQSKTGRHSGEVRLILHYSNANQHKEKMTPPGVQNRFLSYPSVSTAPASLYPPTTIYSAPSPYTGYPPNPASYPPPPHIPAPAAYLSQAYPPLPQSSTYYPTGASGVYPPPPAGTYPPLPY